MLLEKLSDENWDTLVSVSPYASFFHNSFWINSVCRLIGGISMKILASDNQRKWVIPIYFGLPWSSTFRIGSIGYGGPLPLYNAIEPTEERAKIEKIRSHLQKEFQLECSGITTFPWHCWNAISTKAKEELAETQIISLPTDEDYAFTKILSGNVRTAIRRAEGYLISLLDETMGEEAYTLLQSTQLRVGSSYLTQKSFFLHLLKHRNEGVQVWGAFDRHNNLVAMSLLLLGQREAFHLFHGWDLNSKLPGLNQALIWEMIKSSIQKKCTSFNMGESHSPNLKNAKKRWGAKSCPILKIRD